VIGWERVVGATGADSENTRTETATCPSGKRVVGGGWEVSSVSSTDDVIILSSWASSNDTWSVTGALDGTGGDTSYALTAYALCINP
jgi:hypothetical protein